MIFLSGMLRVILRDQSSGSEQACADRVREVRFSFAGIGWRKHGCCKRNARAESVQRILADSRDKRNGIVLRVKRQLRSFQSFYSLRGPAFPLQQQIGDKRRLGLLPVGGIH